MIGFDVVVVGGGAAGCVVAARLAETSSLSVLLLEAGPDLRADPPPLMHDGWQMFREYPWGYESLPDANGTAWPLFRGKLVGGTSWMTRYVVRGSTADFDEWVRLGNPAWGYDDVLPYFTRLEHDLDFGDRPWHGSTGPIPITRYPDVEPGEFEAAAVAACIANGFKPVEDLNQPGVAGIGRMPRNARDGVRVTSADGYLPADGSKPNLELRAGAQVDRIVLDGTTATGVRLVDGTVITAGQVVLCAGTYASPLILMRSGVGPAAHLREHGIDVRVDLPGVGSNLADHSGPDIDPGMRCDASTVSRFHSLATFHSSVADTTDPPDLALWVADPLGTANRASFDVLLMRPKSRGSVRLRSADPDAAPLIDLPGLRESIDVDRLCEAFARAWEINADPRLRAVCTDPPGPAPENADDIRDIVRRDTGSIPHVVGTCAMGPRPEDGAVVDSRGSVHGVDRLTVVDASIIPTPPSGFPHVITLMMAERIAEQLASSLGR